MKKLCSLLMAVVMLCSLVIPAYAAENTVDYSVGTQVEYSGNGTEQYTITVPAELAPGASGDVTLVGTWASDRIISVTAQEKVTLTNSINENDTKDLAVTFAGIEKAGDNTAEKSYTEAVSVAEMPADALFGTWSGVFEYNVAVKDKVPTKTLTIEETALSSGVWTTIEYEEGMTWAQWIDSEYNTVGLSTFTNTSTGTTMVILNGNVFNWLCTADWDAVDAGDVIAEGVMLYCE